MKSGARVKAAAQVHDQLSSNLAGEAKRLDSRDLQAYSWRFGHDFSRVRIFDGPRSASLAGSLGARGVAAKDNVVLGEEEERGEETLAHELAHVAQMDRKGPALSRMSAEREARSAASGKADGLHAAASDAYMEDEDEKKEPPAAPTTTAAADTAASDKPVVPPPLAPLAPSTSGYQLPADFWGDKYNLKVKEPLFTPGAGPATPRAATGGDVASAVTKIPAISQMLSGMGDKATGDLSKAWTGSDWKGKTFMGLTGAALAGGLALPLLMPQSREQAAASPPYSFLQNTQLPLGPLGMQFNLAGEDKNFKLMLDLAKIWKPLQ